MFCPQCGAPNEEDAVFCGNCGAVLRPEEVAPGATAADVEATASTAAAPEVTPVEEPGEMPADDRVEVIPAPPPPPRPPRAYVSTAVQTSGLAIASLVVGIGGLTLVPLLGSILAIVLGYMARNDIRQRSGQVTGGGLATAGIVLGWIGIGLSVLGLLLGLGFGVCGLCGAFGSGNY
jgi:Domain of unknown function (DUF4190)/zinc-ribbon domain